MYLYDRAKSRGDDFAIGLGGFFALGIFTFVAVFTWLQKVHHPISSGTPLFAWCACITLPIVTTFLDAREVVGDNHWTKFFLGDWAAIVLFSSLAWLVCRRWYV
jgi:hypothetical protein